MHYFATCHWKMQGLNKWPSGLCWTTLPPELQLSGLSLLVSLCVYISIYLHIYITFWSLQNNLTTWATTIWALSSCLNIYIYNSTYPINQSFLPQISPSILLQSFIFRDQKSYNQEIKKSEIKKSRNQESKKARPNHFISFLGLLPESWLTHFLVNSNTVVLPIF